MESSVNTLMESETLGQLIAEEPDGELIILLFLNKHDICFLESRVKPVKNEKRRRHKKCQCPVNGCNIKPRSDKFEEHLKSRKPGHRYTDEQIKQAKIVAGIKTLKSQKQRFKSSDEDED